ncbi:PLP-dependent cysteine synthase family protein [Escherichia coli]|uniref:PLP-dependent cysteine synthase family protein n=1 Tax=Escherichia coli TaxID=562 RepID=UPI001EFDE7A7|nr:PLP-dependent cysteine synthase family protein [Escherichia coli]MCG9391164.1 PLP-dependent cysteine synthase family protein [Escherichia coli]MCG9400046.1 PLP-dependent cysteine synthase family protein [Escherichia coli]MCG9452591.1 PLP-dependent cysteine synthase family protein [Escherichia coli]MCG9457189.1 PLP-dependent cysteine synthase family protein [Escherichia coli]MCG9476225.1 PLP-dependent cysteine synthase family protein [Escherichia coli]
MKNHNGWVKKAIDAIEADYQRSADTHLVKLDIPQFPDIDMYLKDESTHPTGSLKHRLARSLFLYGLCNGWIKETTTIIEASSGSTAVSEAWFSKLLGLPFIAVVPSSTASAKIKQIEFYGGRCEFVNSPSEIYEVSERLALENNGHFMNQFKYAERATDWRGNNNIAESILKQMSKEPSPIPSAIVMSAGTGGTLATLGRFVKFKGLPIKIVGVDPENSVFYDYWITRDEALSSQKASRIEGIGRPRVEPSFVPTVIDNMFKIKDKDSASAMHYLHKKLGRRVGASTGTNFIGMLNIAKEMRSQNQKGSLVTLICDSGERYLDTWYDEAWLRHEVGKIEPLFNDILS